MALPVISNQKMNDYLKELGELAEINEPVRETYYKGNECPRRLYAYGGYAHAAYHVLHAVYIFEQTSDYGADYAK